MWKRITPHECFNSVTEIDPERLRDRGIEAVLIDLDNTIVPWGSDEIAPEVLQWMGRVRRTGLKVCLTSNAVPGRVARLGEILDVPGVAKAGKPRRRAFRIACRKIAAAPGRSAVVGDQLFTDVWGGRRSGAHTILVHPLAAREFLGTRVMRRVERRVLRAMERRGQLPGGLARTRNRFKS